jgi:hypothetical protein
MNKPFNLEVNLMFLQSNLDKLVSRKEELNLTNQNLAEVSGLTIDIIDTLFCDSSNHSLKEVADALAHTMIPLMEAMDLSCYYINNHDDAGFYVIRPTPAYVVSLQALLTKQYEE